MLEIKFISTILSLGKMTLQYAKCICWWIYEGKYSKLNIDLVSNSLKEKFETDSEIILSKPNAGLY